MSQTTVLRSTNTIAWSVFVILGVLAAVLLLTVRTPMNTTTSDPLSDAPESRAPATPTTWEGVGCLVPRHVASLEGLRMAPECLEAAP